MSKKKKVAVAKIPKKGTILGKGNFGVVKRSTRWGKPVAVKSFRDTSQEEIKLEVAAHKALQSDGDAHHILQLLHVNTKGYCHTMITGLTFPLLVGDAEHHKKKTQGSLITITRSLLEALDYMKNKNVVHRDIKPNNLLLYQKGDGYDIKVGDLGLAYCNGAKEDPFSSGGTSDYMAPERFVCSELKTLESFADYTKSDVWSAGCTLYYLLTQGEFVAGHDPVTMQDNNRNIAYLYLIFKRLEETSFLSEFISSHVMPRLLYYGDLNTAPPLVDTKLNDLESAHPEVVAMIRAALTVDPNQRPDAGVLLENLDAPVREHSGASYYSCDSGCLSVSTQASV